MKENTSSTVWGQTKKPQNQENIMYSNDIRRHTGRGSIAMGLKERGEFSIYLPENQVNGWENAFDNR